MAQNSTPQHSFLPQPQDKKNYLKIFLKFLQFWIDLLSQIFILSWKKTLVYFPTQKFIFFPKMFLHFKMYADQVQNFLYRFILWDGYWLSIILIL